MPIQNGYLQDACPLSAIISTWTHSNYNLIIVQIAHDVSVRILITCLIAAVNPINIGHKTLAIRPLYLA
jgi:hypothetical protein